MKSKFNAYKGLILVKVQVQGPTGSVDLSFALDTGANFTIINQSRLIYLGYDPATSQDRFQMVTGSGVEFVARLPVATTSALGIQYSNFPVVAHTLPPSAIIDGLLGLDFLRSKKLCIDFRDGVLELE